MLKMDEVGFLLIEGFREGLVKKVVLIKDPWTINPSEIVDHPCHPKSIHLSLASGEFLFFRVLFPAEDMDLMIQTDQCLREIERIELNACIFFRGKTVADLEDFHSLLKKDFIPLSGMAVRITSLSISKEPFPYGFLTTVR